MQNFRELEETILERWDREQPFETSLEERRKAGAKPFVFFEGPPTANGRPGIHHVLARAFKDVVCRYKAMKGYLVERKAGWDTHGLPVELEVEKKLGLRSKKEIEEYGIAAFNRKCKESVWTYKDEWEKLTRRMGYWLDMAHPYITYATPYMETLWWILKQVWDKGLFYQGHKVIHYCTRCGTGLSTHEVAQGYKNVEEDSVYMKFRLKPGQKIRGVALPENTYILSWTTTPWTLPGNIALAVGENITYHMIPWEDGAKYIIAAERQTILGELFGKAELAVEAKYSGKDLLGLEYEPLFEFAPLKSPKSYKVYPADFVTTSDGTGVVHTAVMYGEEDYQLGLKVGLPQVHTVDENGRFVAGIEGLSGMAVKSKDQAEQKKINDLIFEHLKQNGNFLATQRYAHDYPFCWRCDSPLLYYAKPSWFVAMSKLRDKLIANNETVNWVPAHMREGRFGEWLREVKDWNFSRERYWGTPLPVWCCEKCGAAKCIGSIEELEKSAVGSGNSYWIMRHGQADSNCMNLIHSCNDLTQLRSHLTEKGRNDAADSAKFFKDKGIDLIVASPFERTRETAEIVAMETGSELKFDERLVELDHGDFHGKPIPEYLAYYAQNGMNRFTQSVPGGESLNQVKARMMAVVRELEKKYQNKKILIISHGDPLLMLRGAARNLARDEEFENIRESDYIVPAGFRELPVKPLPYDEEGNVNLHRPYVDEIKLSCSDPSCGGNMVRIKEIADVWFDSGSMPFAQHHFPFAYADPNELPFPADYISEGIDQTRGWFYTLLAVSTLLGKPSPYKNVISLAHILDAKGQKMSKHVGNVVNPWDVIEKYGVDALRWYFFTVNEPGDYKLFEEKQISDRLRGFIGTFWNCVVFYRTYAGKDAKIGSIDGAEGMHVLDRWILSKLNELSILVAAKMAAYDVTAAARALESFVIDDLSQWYVRRSRDRLQSDQSGMAIFGFAMRQVAIIAAPFVPFIADAAWRELGQDRSVHLETLPETRPDSVDGALSEAMKWVRTDASKGLALRAESGIKIRQPLSSYTSSDLAPQLEKISDPSDREALKEILAQELNVKEIKFGKTPSLDTQITPDLKMEGEARELMRLIQDARKKTGFKPGEKISLVIGEKNMLKLMEDANYGPIIIERTSVKEWQFEPGAALQIKRAENS